MINYVQSRPKPQTFTRLNLCISLEFAQMSEPFSFSFLIQLFFQIHFSPSISYSCCNDEHSNPKSDKSISYILCIFYSYPYYWLVLPFTFITIAITDLMVNLCVMWPHQYPTKLVVYYLKISH